MTATVAQSKPALNLPQFIAKNQPWVSFGVLVDVRDCQPSIISVPFKEGQKKEMVHAFVKSSLRMGCAGHRRYLCAVRASYKMFNVSRENFRSLYRSEREAAML